jgi:hypothetical protein
MSLTLPDPLPRYVAAQNAHDADALIACFAEDARVRDEGEDIVGLAAIRRWKEETSRKYRVTVEPKKIETADGATIMTATVSGAFPGSPIDLRYRFTLKNGLIAALEIVP